jgi:hypothetical protein
MRTTSFMTNHHRQDVASLQIRTHYLDPARDLQRARPIFVRARDSALVTLSHIAARNAACNSIRKD